MTLVALNVVEVYVATVNVNVDAFVVVCPSNVVVAGVVDVPALANVFEFNILKVWPGNPY